MPSEILIYCENCEQFQYLDHYCPECEEPLLWRQCSNCDHILPIGSAEGVFPYCGQCGEENETTFCPRCGEENDYENLFCDNCDHCLGLVHCICGEYTEVGNYCSQCGYPIRGITCPHCQKIVHHANGCCHCLNPLPPLVPGSQIAAVPAAVPATLSPVEAKITEINKRLQAASRSNFALEIIQSAKINGYASGNKIMITSRLAELFNEGEIAYVLAHEIAHNQLGHPSSSGRRFDTTLDVAEKSPILGIALFFLNQYVNRSQEKTADGIAIAMMAKAGYDPRDAISALKRLGGSIADYLPSLIMSHPKKETRIDNLQRSIANGKR